MNTLNTSFNKGSNNASSLQQKDFTDSYKGNNGLINNLNATIKAYKWIDWFAFGLFIVYCVSTCFFIYDVVKGLIEFGPWGAWVNIDRFTDQSNLLLWLFMLFFIFFKKHSFLKNNQWLLSNMTYIFFTFIGYNVILVGIGHNQYGGNNATTYDVFSSAWYHVLNPISYLVFGFCYFYCNQFKQPKNYWISMLKQIIYPTIYIIYAISIPYVMQTNDGLPKNNDFADNYLNEGHYSVYGSFTNIRDHLATALPVILCVWLIFFPGAHAIFYYSWYGMNKIERKNKH